MNIFIYLCTMGELNVCFQIDTDDRKNFPSEAGFQILKNQRDTFFEIFRMWEKNYSLPGWTFQIALGSKIRTMLTLHNDASQLLISCIQNRQQVNPNIDSSLTSQGYITILLIPGFKSYMCVRAQTSDSEIGGR
ncbi:hypothetical protein E2986_12510 [Frieseomelitta varia]|uniref:Uncharacterized protein n=1 Tax=Frieseomelitta varia TaxID=561572 RepID=A0A833SHP8_9HYME|nr:hypothetical protein E2986_12510 [Frieseomelitta varia]